MTATPLEQATTWTDADRWRAVEARDRSADGAFVYAVRSTGVYCRPSCPARRPRRENAAFYETPEAAEAAGFRPCTRCHPPEVGRVAAAVARTQRRLDEAAEAPALAFLAAEVGVSPFHLQRAFKAALG
ncbi:MAG TPA: Ada metal-binding domain-containing protein, partial [Deinococcales bacterium]|nr:Ada metal-binding domain-containing protein [Deinococcales bacterium]